MERWKSLRKIRIFSSLQEEALRELASFSQGIKCEAKEVIFEENDPGEDLYILEKGRVRITKNISPGVEKVLLILTSGAVFGEMAWIGEGRRSANAVALESCELIQIGKQDFEEFLKRYPQDANQILLYFCRTLIQRLRITTDSYKDSLLWGMQVSGASQLNFDRLIDEKVELELELSSGRNLKGRLLKVDTSVGGCELTLMDEKNCLILVPYNSVSCIFLQQCPIQMENLD